MPVTVNEIIGLSRTEQNRTEWNNEGGDYNDNLGTQRSMLSSINCIHLIREENL